MRLRDQTAMVDGEAVQMQSREGVCVCVCVPLPHTSLCLSQQGVCGGGTVERLDLKGKLSASLRPY